MGHSFRSWGGEPGSAADPPVGVLTDGGDRIWFMSGVGVLLRLGVLGSSAEGLSHP
jgi:hypothetical protein